MSWGSKGKLAKQLERHEGGKASHGAASTAASPPKPSAPYRVAIAERDEPHHSIELRLGGVLPAVESGGGGYAEVELPKRGAVSIWQRRSLMRMHFDVRLDRTERGEAVESAYSVLLRMWRPVKDSTPPPVIRIAALGDTLPYQELDWTIDNVEWAEAQGNEKGERTEQVLTITLQEFRPDERLETASQHKKKGHTKTIEVKNPKKETLGSIARQYHVKGGVKALAEAQHPPIKDPRHLHKGQKITVPLP